ncbi:hypothetical protein RFI_19865 [Reticulomyxa filosa]|uniref:Uncharacterized protein n=1 Tax=Reticulomyxa filosa TaxID=46433 RepID=X6MUH1_RETFI|nr:hypothetical protein RFI_19865 [Reticulomyxa filosa]|eukprot:ETO17454.1 hypothetical protein RFI_19865 [Reticulomyxa filosa]
MGVCQCNQMGFQNLSKYDKFEVAIQSSLTVSGFDSCSTASDVALDDALASVFCADVEAEAEADAGATKLVEEESQSKKKKMSRETKEKKRKQNDKIKFFGRAKRQGASSGKIKRNDIGREKRRQFESGILLQYQKEYQQQKMKEEMEKQKRAQQRNKGAKFENKDKPNVLAKQHKQHKDNKRTQKMNAKLALVMQKVSKIKEQIKLAIDIELKKLKETEKAEQIEQPKFKKLNQSKKLNSSKR